MLMGMIGPSKSGTNVFSSYVKTDAPAGVGIGSGSSQTFAAVNFGTAASNRIAIVCVTANVNGFDTMTIGGVSATLASSALGGVVSQAQIWYAALPTGTTADVVLNWSGAAPHDLIIVAGAFNYGTSSAVIDSKWDAGGSGGSVNSITCSTNIPSGGFAVMLVVQQHTSQTATWTNMTAAGGDTTTQVTDGSNPNTMYTAHSTTSGSPTSLNWSVGVGDFTHGCSASWGT